VGGRRDQALGGDRGVSCDAVWATAMACPMMKNLGVVGRLSFDERGGGEDLLVIR